MAERRARIHFDDWAGKRSTPVVVVAETPKRYRIRTVDENPVRLAGAGRWLRPSETVLVPKRAVTFGDEPAQTGESEGSKSDG